MTRYFVGIGSNENAVHNCTAMISAIRSAFRQVCVSSIVQTPAYGVDAPHYLNAVVSFEALLSIPELYDWCKKLETQLGRTRTRNGICQADLDILQPGHVSEVYYQPLVLQLQAFLKGEAICVSHDKVCLQLDERMSVGDAPCYLFQTESV
ncbi:2-amino-4-hydroxy-6-hydroxymethyldihydropteridine diphosphokinase [Endozoicomonas gorgoniicola]|uniref:2-amino-4-hydroxy-6-hydroxymethyldihydropteridine pyrophosphokinase n=1 Tax=Endozoicomonas gorgoniicola TaxID=1234144 RepID=A0ABT3N3G0_9GAMM|nr:2-amino-4-hydroxy-6-hydroxymethyldihydropteridine diphosphokinase [Endozoicomonas gorgoniicola]MCW7556149.1 2-amino-4-hydroxy-6-hydroxymethyldihydropteridine diphosphokinase [Endozoicomonas gorgoniicola]